MYNSLNNFVQIQKTKVMTDKKLTLTQELGLELQTLRTI